MFSSLTKKLASFGPRALLAAQIAKALSEYFVVDPDEIESSLLNDARIVLRNTELRKKHYRRDDAPNVVVNIEGVVEEVVFSWTWSFSSYTDSGMIKDATLTTKGLKVDIRLQAWDELKDADVEVIDASTGNGDGKSSDTSKTGNDGFMETYIQQIIDHLTLKIHDCQFSVHLENGASLDMTGEGIELTTLAAANVSVNKTILSQLLSLRAFSLVVRDGNNKYPLIDPFGYAVSVTRVSGKRFQGGILSGLEVIGLLRDEEIRFHIGREQLKILCDIGILLRPSPPDNNQEVERCREMSKEGETKENLNLSTTFTLALPDVSLMIPPSTKNPLGPTSITLASATFEYKTDGTVCKIGGSKGITDNGDSLIELNTGCWELDLVTQTFSIKNGTVIKGSNEIGKADATIHVRESSLKRIHSSIKEILETEEMSILQETYSDTAEKMRTQEKDSSTWTFVMEGNCMFCAEGQREIARTERVEVLVAPTKLIASPDADNGGYAVSELTCGGMKLKSTIDDLFKVDIPPLSLLDGTLQVEGIVKASMTSTEHAKEIQEFFILFKPLQIDSGSVMGAEVSVSDLDFIPFNFLVKGFKVFVQKNTLDIEISRVQGTANSILLESITYTDYISNSFTTSDIAIRPKSRSSANILVGRVNTCNVPGVFSIASPIMNLAVDVSTDNISVNLQRLHLSLQKQKEVNPNDVEKVSAKHKDTAKFEFNAALTIEHLQVDMFQGRDEHVPGKVQVKNLSLVASGGLTMKIEMQRKLNFCILDSHSDWIKGDVEPFHLETNIMDPMDLQLFHSIGGSSVTSSSFGSLEMNVAGSSFKAIAIQSVKFPELMVGHIEMKCGDVCVLQKLQDFISNVFTGFENGNGTSEASMCSPFPMSFQGANLSAIDQNIAVIVGPISFCDNIILCDEMKCSGSVFCRVKNAKVTCSSSSAVEISIGTIDEILLPERGLSIEPITGTCIVFEDNVLQIKINKIDAKLIQTMVINADIEENKADVAGGLQDGIDLPFSISVEISHSALVLHTGISVCATGLKVDASSQDHLLNIDIVDEINIRLSHHDDWLDMKLQPCFAALSDLSLFPAAFCIGDLSIGPCSLGLLDVKIPSFTLLPDASCITLDDMLSVRIESFRLLQHIQEIYANLQEGSGSKSNVPTAADSSRRYEWPLSLQAPILELHLNEPRTILRLQNLNIKRNNLQCALFTAEGVDEMRVSARNCSLDVQADTDIIAKVEEITAATVPGIVSLAEPCHSISIRFQRGNLYVDIPVIKCDAIKKPVAQGSRKGSASTSLSVPVPTQLRVQAFMLQDLSVQSSISVQNFAAGIKQSGSSLYIRTEKGIKVRGQHSGHWIDACVDTSSVCISFEDSVNLVKEVNCVGMLIGPASPSCGHFKARFDRLHHNGESLEISETVNVSMKQLDSYIVENAQSLLQALSDLIPIETEDSSFEFPFPIKVSAIRAVAIEPKITLAVDGVSAAITTVCCEKINATIGQEASVSLSDLNSNFKSMQIEIGLIESLFVSGMIMLSRPVRQAKIEFNNDLSIQLLHPVYINVLPTAKKGEPSQNTENQDLPFPIKVSIRELYLSQQGGKTRSRIDEARLNIQPFIFGGQDLLDETPLKGAKVSMNIKQVSSDLFHVADICFLFVVPLHDLNTLTKMQLSVSCMQVTSGFSSIDWSSLLSSKKEISSINATPNINVPFSQIGSFHLSISYEGKILASQSNILVPSFNGDASTTTDIVMKHYTKVIMQRVPGFLTNAKFLGGNVVDSSLQNAVIATTRVAGSVSMASAGVGSVMGVAVADAVRASIVSGKKARNVDTRDSYKFGDFSRGLVRGAQEAVNTGAKMRGGDTGYIPGDLTAGSTRAVGEYASNNKSKLATAGGSGVASIVGLAVAGPIGFIAGSYFGGKAVKGIVGEDTHNGKQV